MIRTDKRTGKKYNVPDTGYSKPANTAKWEDEESAIVVKPTKAPELPKVGPPELYEQLIPAHWKQFRPCKNINDPEVRRTVRSLVREHGDALDCIECRVFRDDETEEIHLVVDCVLNAEKGIEAYRLLIPHEITANKDNIDEYLCIQATDALFEIDELLWDKKSDSEAVIDKPAVNHADTLDSLVKLNLIDLEVLCPKDAFIDPERFGPLCNSPVKFVAELGKFAQEIKDGTYLKAPTSPDS